MIEHDLSSPTEGRPTERCSIQMSTEDCAALRVIRYRSGTLHLVVGHLVRKLVLKLKEHGITDTTRVDDFVDAIEHATITLGAPQRQPTDNPGGKTTSVSLRRGAKTKDSILS